MTSSNSLNIAGERLIKSVSEELGLQTDALINVAVKLFRLIIMDDVLFYSVAAAIHYWDKDLASELLSIKGKACLEG